MLKMMWESGMVPRRNLKIPRRNKNILRRNPKILRQNKWILRHSLENLRQSPPTVGRYTVISPLPMQMRPSRV